MGSTLLISAHSLWIVYFSGGFLVSLNLARTLHTTANAFVEGKSGIQDYKQSTNKFKCWMLARSLLRVMRGIAFMSVTAGKMPAWGKGSCEVRVTVHSLVHLLCTFIAILSRFFFIQFGDSQKKWSSHLEWTDYGQPIVFPLCRSPKFVGHKYSKSAHCVYFRCYTALHEWIQTRISPLNTGIFWWLRTVWRFYMA